MATLGTLLHTWLHGQSVGKDAYGNRYYQERSGTRLHGKKRRWVVYKGLAEPSKVPASWHGWLHYTTDEVPGVNDPMLYAWEKEHLPNLTGTDLAYRPPGHILAEGKREKATGDYEPWKPV
ncbi:MAG: hypothetical protein K0R63_1376 [Rickettsiales bacterium]|jgi:NADH:ubiquinone oxidoreductase subunit|nr:hypothetical protein [Rickettsiales bacterium]